MISAEALKAIYQQGCQRCYAQADDLYTDASADYIVCGKCLRKVLYAK